MRFASSRVFFAIVILLSGSVLAQNTENAGAVEDEVTRELNDIRQKAIPQGRVHLRFVGIARKPYAIDELSCSLDGKPIGVRDIKTLDTPNSATVFDVEAGDGEHVLEVKVTYLNTDSFVVSDQGGNRYSATLTSRFQVNRGIEVVIDIEPFFDAAEAKWKNKFKIHSQSRARMLGEIQKVAPEQLEEKRPKAIEKTSKPEPEAAPPLEKKIKKRKTSQKSKKPNLPL